MKHMSLSSSSISSASQRLDANQSSSSPLCDRITSVFKCLFWGKKQLIGYTMLGGMSLVTAGLVKDELNLAAAGSAVTLTTMIGFLILACCEEDSIRARRILLPIPQENRESSVIQESVDTTLAVSTGSDDSRTINPFSENMLEDSENPVGPLS